MIHHATVVICTYNRSALLSHTLQALFVQQTPDFTFDILIVDNASTDHTRDVVLSFKDAPIQVRYSYEPTLGLSHARNHAINNVSAQFTVFLDDDAVPEPNWLAALLNTFTEVVPAPSVVGGRVKLSWTDQQPAWMPDELFNVYSYLHYGDEVLKVKYVFGCNVAFPSQLLQTYCYNIRFGLQGRKQITGEDIEILHRMRRDGHLVYYQPKAVVNHIVGKQRENRSYVLRRALATGREQALYTVSTGWSGYKAILLAMAREVINRHHWWKRLALSILSGRMLISSHERTWAMYVLASFWGYEAEMLSLMFKAQKVKKHPNL